MIGINFTLLFFYFTVLCLRYSRFVFAVNKQIENVNFMPLDIVFKYATNNLLSSSS